MPLKSVAILSPGDMGSAVGRALGASGLDVTTCLAGRSARTRKLAERGGFREAPSLEAMLGEADLVLSILPPAAAPEAARRVARAMAASGARPPYADMNAVSPQTARGIGEEIARAGAPYIDGGIIGPPPGRGRTCFYASGPGAPILRELGGRGVEVRLLGEEIGRASAIKMCYAAVTKGTRVLQAAALTAAEALGLTEELREEFQTSYPEGWRQMVAGAPRLPSVSARWIGEMREIARTFEALGLSSKFHEGAAEMLSLIARTPLAGEAPEAIDPRRTLEEALRVYAEHLPGNPEKGGARP